MPDSSEDRRPVPAPREVIVVLGMHRSGTSLLGNILQVCGIAMADDTDRASPRNPGGFWERPDLVALHDEVLVALGRPVGAQDHARPLPESWWTMPAIAPIKARIKNWLQGQLELHEGLWGFKDPRTVRLLPLWREIFAELHLQPRYVIAVREPTEVARSMARKNPKARPLTEAQCELMWIAYNWDIARQVDFAHAFVVDYGYWFQDPGAQLSALLAYLRTDLVSWPRLMPAAQAIIQAEYRHHHHDPSRAVTQLPLTSEFYATLRQFAPPPLGQPELAPVVTLVDTMFRLVEAYLQAAEAPKVATLWPWRRQARG